YIDREAAGSPPVESVFAEALRVPECSGLLLDTWGKGPLARDPNMGGMPTSSWACLRAAAPAAAMPTRTWACHPRAAPVRSDLGPLGEWIVRLHDAGKFLSLAGGLNVETIALLSKQVGPDWFAVRGAACREGDRMGEVDVERVRALSQAAR